MTSCRRLDPFSGWSRRPASCRPLSRSADRPVRHGQPCSARTSRADPSSCLYKPDHEWLLTGRPGPALTSGLLPGAPPCRRTGGRGLVGIPPRVPLGWLAWPRAGSTASRSHSSRSAAMRARPRDRSSQLSSFVPRGQAQHCLVSPLLAMHRHGRPISGWGGGIRKPATCAGGTAIEPSVRRYPPVDRGFTLSRQKGRSCPSRFLPL